MIISLLLVYFNTSVKNSSKKNKNKDQLKHRIDTKFAKIGPSVARSRDVLYSHIGTKFAQNPHFALCLCTKYMEKFADFFNYALNFFFFSVFYSTCL